MAPNAKILNKWLELEALANIVAIPKRSKIKHNKYVPSRMDARAIVYHK